MAEGIFNSRLCNHHAEVRGQPQCRGTEFLGSQMGLESRICHLPGDLSHRPPTHCVCAHIRAFSVAVDELSTLLPDNPSWLCPLLTAQDVLQHLPLLCIISFSLSTRKFHGYSGTF